MLASGTATVTATVNGIRDPDLLKALGLRLKQMRKAKGMTQAEVAEHLKIHGSAVSRLERGEYPAGEYMIKSVERLLALATAEGHESWFISYLEVEQTAVRLRTWEPLVIPGLLQTRPYARCVLRGAYPLRPAAEIERQAEARIDRQLIWDRDEPPPPMMPVVIGEAALRRKLGGTAVMLEQLGHLLDMADHPRITVQVLELSSTGFVGQLAPFVVASFGDGHPDVAHLDNALAGQTTPDPGMVADLMLQYDALARDALGPRDSSDLIRKVMGEWT